MSLPLRVRGELKNYIDFLIQDRKKKKMLYAWTLRHMYLEPNLETILSHSVGLILGLITANFKIWYKREPTPEEMLKILSIIQRRMPDMREAFVDPR